MPLFDFLIGTKQPSNYTAITKPVRNTFDADIVIPANAVKGQAINLTIYTDPENPAITSANLKALSNETWYVYKIKSLGTPNVDGIIKFRVNGINENISFGPLSATLPSLEHVEDFQNDYIVLEPNATGQPYFIANTAGPTVSVTQSIQIYVVRVPDSYTGKVVL